MQHAERKGDEAVENGDDNDGARDSERHVLGGVLHLLGSGGDGVVADVAEVDDRCPVEDSSDSEGCKPAPAGSVIHWSSSSSSCRREVLGIAFHETRDDDEEHEDYVQHGHHHVEGGAFLRADEVKGHKINTAQNSAQRRHGHEEKPWSLPTRKKPGK